MGGPWEDYGGTATVEHGPWEDYGTQPEPKRSVASPLTPPSVPRPQVNMQPMSIADTINAATGHEGYQGTQITPLSIIKGTAQDIGTLMRAGPQAMVKGLVHRPLLGEPPSNEELIRAGTNIGQGYLLGGVEAGEMPRAVRAAETGAAAKVPRQPTSLSPEQQARYTADLDKANANYAAKSQTYHAKVSEAFDTAKQQHLDEVAQHEQKVRDIQAQHAADVQAAQQEFEQATQKERAAREAHETKVQAARESREQAAAQEERKQQITQAQQAMAEDTRQQAQALYQTERQNLNSRWDQVRQQVGTETPVPIQGVVDAMNKAETEYLRGSPGSITKFRQLANELGLGDMTGFAEDADPATVRAGKFYEVNPELPTAPWQTIRTHSANISRAMSSGDLGNVYPAMKLVRNALEKAAGEVAELRGAGAAYKSVLKDEAQFRKDFEDLGPVSLGKGNPAARLVRAPNANFASDIIHGKASDLLEQALERWDKSGQLSTNIQQMRALADELKNLPKIKILQEPAPYTGQAPTLRQVAKPALPQAPTIPERKVNAAVPVLARVERPIPEPPPLTLGQRIVSHIPRVAGKIVGGKIGTAVGHPLIGYGVGGEVGAEVGKTLTRRPIPQSPAAYTRTLLDAKEGKISPGEADRRIIKAGGRVKIRPIPRQEREEQPTP